MPTRQDGVENRDKVYFNGPQHLPQPPMEMTWHLYAPLHEAHTIKIRNNRFHTINYLSQSLNTCKNDPETVLQIRQIQELT